LYVCGHSPFDIPPRIGNPPPPPPAVRVGLAFPIIHLFDCLASPSFRYLSLDRPSDAFFPLVQNFIAGLILRCPFLLFLVFFPPCGYRDPLPRHFHLSRTLIPFPLRPLNCFPSLWSTSLSVSSFLNWLTVSAAPFRVFLFLGTDYEFFMRTGFFIPSNFSYFPSS